MGSFKTREDAILSAINQGIDTDTISRGLVQAGQSPLSTYESTLIGSGRYGTNVLQRAGMDAVDIAKGLSTIGGILGNIASPNEVGKRARSYYGGKLLDYGKQALKGERSVAEDVANFFISPTGVNVQDIARDPIQSSKSAIAGVGTRPLENALNLAPFVPKGTLSKAINIIPDEVGGLNTIGLKTMVAESPRQKEINKVLNDTTKYAEREAQYASRLDEFNKKYTPAERELAVRNLTTGNWIAGSEQVTKDLRNIAKEFGRDLEDVGVSTQQMRDTSVNQFILESIDPQRKKNIFLGDIRDAAASPTKANLGKIGLSTPEELTNLISKGNELYDKGLITPITQRGLNRNIFNEVEGIHDGIRSERYLGSATPSDVASNLTRGYTKLWEEIKKARELQDNITEMGNKFGRKLTVDEVGKMAKDEVLISPEELRDIVGKRFGTNNSLRGMFEKPMSESSLSRYANDLYAIKKSDLRGLINKVNGTTPTSTLTKISNALEIPMNLWKGSVLAKPQYFAGNRIGNAYLAALGGADYLTALNLGLSKSGRELIPQALRYSTSFRGLNPSIFDSGLLGGSRKAIEEVRASIANIKSPELTGSEKLKEVGNIIKSSQDILTKPLFALESTGELIDRLAVYSNEAKKLARERGVSTESILKEARKDLGLQRDLIGRVNNTLGDYTGTNYFSNPDVHKFLRTITPFSKVITTSKDVLSEQLRSHPFRYQFTQRLPYTIGQEELNLQRQYGQPVDDDTRGGSIVIPSVGTLPSLVRYNNYNPLSAVFELGEIVAPSDKGGLASRLGETYAGKLSPVLGLSNALQGQDRYGNMVMGNNTYSVGGKLITLDENGNRIEQSPNVAGAIAGYSRQYFPVATLMNNAILPTIGAITGEGYRSPNSQSFFGQIGDKEIPILSEGKRNQLPIKDITELGNFLTGFYTRDVRTPYTPRLTRQDIMQAMKKRQRDYALQQYRQQYMGGN